jgi:hypothetical protein
MSHNWVLKMAPGQYHSKEYICEYCGLKILGTEDTNIARVNSFVNKHEDFSCDFVIMKNALM